MKAEFVIKAECTYECECEDKASGEEWASYIKGLLRAVGIDAKVLIGNLKYDGFGKKEAMKLERLRQKSACNSC